jgi:hypothetical protein
MLFLLHRSSRTTDNLQLTVEDLRSLEMVAPPNDVTSPRVPHVKVEEDCYEQNQPLKTNGIADLDVIQKGVDFTIEEFVGLERRLRALLEQLKDVHDIFLANESQEDMVAALKRINTRPHQEYVKQKNPDIPIGWLKTAMFTLLGTL